MDVARQRTRVVGTAIWDNFAACETRLDRPTKTWVVLLLQNDGRSYFLLAMDRDRFSAETLTRFRLPAKGANAMLDQMHTW